MGLLKDRTNMGRYWDKKKKEWSKRPLSVMAKWLNMSRVSAISSVFLIEAGHVRIRKIDITPRTLIGRVRIDLHPFIAAASL